MQQYIFLDKDSTVSCTHDGCKDAKDDGVTCKHAVCIVDGKGLCFDGLESYVIDHGNCVFCDDECSIVLDMHPKTTMCRACWKYAQNNHTFSRDERELHKLREWKWVVSTMFNDIYDAPNLPKRVKNSSIVRNLKKYIDEGYDNETTSPRIRKKQKK